MRRTMGWLAVTAVLLGVSVEVGSRVAHERTRGTVTDASGLYRFPPHAAVWGGHPTNALGFFGDDLAVPKPADAYRVLLMSDSTSLAISLPRIIQHELAQRIPHRTVEVNLVSPPRYTTTHNLDLLRSALLELEPDLVVMYVGINDNLFNTSEGDRHANPGIFDSRALGSVALRMGLYRFFERPRRTTDFTRGELPSAPIFEANVREMVRLIRGNGGEILLLPVAISQPTDDARLQARTEAHHRDLEHNWGNLASTVRGARAHQEILAALARDESVPIADPTSVLPRDGSTFRDICHLTPTAHERLGAWVAATIAERVPTDETSAQPASDVGPL